MEFTLTLKNEKVKYYKNIRNLVMLLHFIYFIFLLISFAGTSLQKITLIAGLLICSVYLFFLFIKKIKQQYDYPGWLPQLPMLLALVWLGQRWWWMSGVVLALYMLDRLATRRLALLFTEKHIRFPSVPVRKIAWHELNNAVLRDGLLTLDFKNNKLLQAEVVAGPENTDEPLFNDFCTTQLNK